jgi:hypothetical protein
VLIGRRYLALSRAKPKAKTHSNRKKLLQRIERNGTTFSHEANRQPHWLLPYPEAEL